jgi:lipoprotein signal peptidase
VAATAADDLLQPSVLSHARSPLIYLFGVVVAVALVVLAPRARSLPLALGAGVAAGGALATAVCGVAWSGGVPNPLVRGEVAFNLADVAIAVGVVVLIAAALAELWRQRGRLHEPV